MADIDEPIGWRVSAIDGKKDHVDGYKQRPLKEDFKTRDEAVARADALKLCGMVSTVTPVFMSKIKRNRAMMGRQTTPFGEFAKDWKLHR